MAVFGVTFEGMLVLDRVPRDFTERVAQRVRAGLFRSGSRVRANYAVRHHDSSVIAFGADDALTAFNIGLNEVVLRRLDDRRVSYQVDYGRWARYACYLGLVIMAPLLLVLLIPQVRQAYGVHPVIPVVYWSQALFWGIAWPWILVRFHRRAAARCLEHIVREVCLGATTPAFIYSGTSRRYQSEARLFGMPLVAIAVGPDRESGQVRGVAKGFIAIGDVAVGVVAFGGIALGGVAVGGLAVGALALGGAAVGLCALGGGAAGLFAMGGGAVGIVAIGGGALGIRNIGPGSLGGL